MVSGEYRRAQAASFGTAAGLYERARPSYPPSAGMRAELARVMPSVRVLAGAAEQIPLPDRSVDAVLVAQA